MLTEEEIRAFLTGGNSGEAEIKKVQFPSLSPAEGMSGVKTGMSHLEDIQIEIGAELGQATMKVREVLGLAAGAVIKLDKATGDAVEVTLNRQGFARGEVIVINDNFGVRITSVNHAYNQKLSEGLV
ncbi:MAG: Flagellar motor switch/type III secretory pathway protein [Pelotomaculum thermopropionicum]|uniref:Flagellar motor switch/type III secretory pathway protein n=1 Tax=Pelotomaculum thermopropionicum TaxID=110500 RepID=A0A124FYF9_9FIRM|nr:MAG: Flagellar motor switch/type III secretory pathway protein [Pelotomaculum thermopropionicum]